MVKTIKSIFLGLLSLTLPLLANNKTSITRTTTKSNFHKTLSHEDMRNKNQKPTLVISKMGAIREDRKTNSNKKSFHGVQR